MAPQYTLFRGKSVSLEWGIVLAAVALRVDFRLNSGHRTMAEQERLVREKGVWSPSNPTGAARPSPIAPHIRVGRIDHALDIDTNAGAGENAVQRELARLGVPTHNPIPREPWHVEANDADDLRRAAARLGKPDPRALLTPRERRLTDELISLRRMRSNPKRLARRAAIKAWILVQRAALAHAGTRHRGAGWKEAHRLERFRYLVGLTKEKR